MFSKAVSGLFVVSVGLFGVTIRAVTQIGNVVIDNGENPAVMIENNVIVGFFDECSSGTTSQERSDELVSIFPCISALSPGGQSGFITFPSDDHSYLLADISDTSCLDDTMDLSHLCIDSIINNFEIDEEEISEGDNENNGGDDGRDDNGRNGGGGSETHIQREHCIDVDVFPFSIDYSYALDQFDTFDGEFEAFRGNDESVNIYIVDIDGIIVEHSEFYKVSNLYLPFPFDETYDKDDLIFGDHGTSVASCVAGIRYGAAVSNQVIYNVYTPTFFDILFGLVVVDSHLDNSENRRGVVVMSFDVTGAPLFLRNLFDAILNSIISHNGIPLAAAGNRREDVCETTRIPNTLDSTITVGSHNAFYRSAFSSSYGDCVDIYGPGVGVRAAVGTVSNGMVINNNDYGFVFGTSFANPYIAGIVVNWLVECEKTGFYEPCRFENIKERLNDWTVPVGPSFFNPIGDQCGSTGVPCEAAQYFCGRPFWPRETSRCRWSPCAEYESGNCRVYNDGSGCSQCESGSFKISSNHPCERCSDVMGPACLFCQDGQGCGQCIDNNLYYLVTDGNTGLRYCKPQPCLGPRNNCRVCNNGFCSQCRDGFRLNSDGKSCNYIF